MSRVIPYPGSGSIPEVTRVFLVPAVITTTGSFTGEMICLQLLTELHSHLLIRVYTYTGSSTNQDDRSSATSTTCSHHFRLLFNRTIFFSDNSRSGQMPRRSFKRTFGNCWWVTFHRPDFFLPHCQPNNGVKTRNEWWRPAFVVGGDTRQQLQDSDSECDDDNQAALDNEDGDDAGHSSMSYSNSVFRPDDEQAGMSGGGSAVPAVTAPDCDAVERSRSSLNLSLSVLVAIFPGEPGLTGSIETKDDGSDSDYWSYKTRAELQTKHYHQQTNIWCFTSRMPFLSPNQQCQST